jgi:hypothetical protein
MCLRVWPRHSLRTLVLRLRQLHILEPSRMLRSMPGVPRVIHRDGYTAFYFELFEAYIWTEA